MACDGSIAIVLSSISDVFCKPITDATFCFSYVDFVAFRARNRINYVSRCAVKRLFDVKCAIWRAYAGSMVDVGTSETNISVAGGSAWLVWRSGCS